MCITMFATTSERDNSQALVMGSCLLGEDGGNRWEQECARLVSCGSAKEVPVCVGVCTSVRVDAGVSVCFPKLCLLSDRKTEM